MIAAQMVVLSAVAADDFKWQVEGCPSGVLILLMDTMQTSDTTALHEAREKRQQFLRDLILEDDQWGGLEFECSVGAFLYRKNTIAHMRELGV